MSKKCKKCLWVVVPGSCNQCAFNPQTPANKPPLGIKPRRIHDEERVRELRACIARYMQAGYHLDPDWVSEYNEIIERQMNEEQAGGIVAVPL